mmetsp:Transcript_88916/g.278536  ORF Transcript_88916/g.278536 Transcript_88916/m.278536 type:complete len:335 (+) Transcript_88916:211-1215(+)
MGGGTAVWGGSRCCVGLVEGVAVGGLNVFAAGNPVRRSQRWAAAVPGCMPASCRASSISWGPGAAFRSSSMASSAARAAATSASVGALCGGPGWGPPAPSGGMEPSTAATAFARERISRDSSARRTSTTPIAKSSAVQNAMAGFHSAESRASCTTRLISRGSSASVESLATQIAAVRATSSRTRPSNSSSRAQAASGWPCSLRKTSAQTARGVREKRRCTVRSFWAQPMSKSVSSRTWQQSSSVKSSAASESSASLSAALLSRPSSCRPCSACSSRRTARARSRSQSQASSAAAAAFSLAKESPCRIGAVSALAANSRAWAADRTFQSANCSAE